MHLSASVWPGLAARGQPARACGNGGALGRAKTVNGAHHYTSRTVPAAVDVLGLANPTALVLVNGIAATRKGEYFYRSVSAPNSAGPWFTTNSVQSLYGGASPESGTLFVPQTPEVFTPDPDGNLVRDGRWDYTWDGENRLVRMESLTNAPAQSRLRVEFGYDYQGRRIWKRVTSLSTGSVLQERKFVYDGWNLVAELSADLRLFKSFSWGLDLSGSLQGAGGVGGLLWVSHFLSGQVTGTDFATYDGNGNVAALVGASSGALSARYEYGPFGEVLRATGPMAKANPFRFSTKYQDGETDLLYYGYRYYGASTGRWLSRDPINELAFRYARLFEGFGWSQMQRGEAVGALNEDASHKVYVFVQNRPVSQIDVLGLFNDGFGGQAGAGQFRGHSDFYGHTCFDYTLEDHDPNTEPVGHPAGHFQNLGTSLQQVRHAIQWCDRNAFQRAMHRLQDFWSHYNKGYRWNPPFHLGHLGANPNPDNDNAAWAQAEHFSRQLVQRWNSACHCEPCWE